MQKLIRTDLLTLEAYAAQRTDLRKRALAHKRLRTLHLGEHMTLLFEDSITVQAQVQEMLRIERIFEAAGIQEELDAYNPLIPDGSNLKATLLIEYTDPEHRAVELARLRGIERAFFAEVAGHERAGLFVDEDLDRSDDDKTSAVHFMRFEFTAEAIAALKSGSTMRFGIDDPRMPLSIEANTSLRAVLLADFD
ncbi:MAG: DUF3501 family protein [Lysobacteraceae bacterium]